jgi:hypothetical protein
MLLVVTRPHLKRINYKYNYYEANEDEIVYRNGAKQTDLLVVTGDIGAAYILQVLERENKFFR